LTLLVSALLLAGCVVGAEPEEVGVAQSADQSENGLEVNGLAYNGLNYNGLTYNGVSYNGLNYNGLNYNGISYNGIAYNGLNYNGISYNGIAYNGLNYNGIAYNGIAYNGLNYNGISYNGLDRTQPYMGIATGALGTPTTCSGCASSTITSYVAPNPILLAAVQDSSSTGDVTRHFVSYLASCALDSTQALTFSWTDALGAAHNELYQGALAMAPNWATGALSITDQGNVSACMAARVNYFGVHVSISLRSQKHVITTTSDELAAYSYIEGAFWGNMFASPGRLYSCFNPATIARARAEQRDCAAGYDNGNGISTTCGPIIIVGPCDAVCNQFDPTGQYYKNCYADPMSNNSASTQQVVTIGIQ
jgi:hypothetical protein